MRYKPTKIYPKSDSAPSLIRFAVADVSFVLVKGKAKVEFLKKECNIDKPVFNLEVFGCEKFARRTDTENYFTQSYCAEPLHQPNDKVESTASIKG